MAFFGKSEPLALLIASGVSVRVAAEQTGTPERTAYRITATDEFRRRVSELRSEIAGETVGSMTIAARQASATLLELLSEKQEPSIRLQASKAILASVASISELGELRQRLDRLEQGIAK